MTTPAAYRRTRGEGMLERHGERRDWPSDGPAPTLTEKARSDTWQFAGARCTWKLRNGTQKNACTRDIDKLSGTLFFGHQAYDVSWITERPATTIAADPRIGNPGGKDWGAKEPQFKPDAIRVTVEQAAVLQGFPADYPWQGSRTSQYRQIGNAVPPPLAAAISRSFRGVA